MATSQGRVRIASRAARHEVKPDDLVVALERQQPLEALDHQGLVVHDEDAFSGIRHAGQEIIPEASPRVKDRPLWTPTTR